jgi:hypothetical protein
VFRGFITAGYQSLWVYTQEVYPTSIRTTALGLHHTFSRIGAMITPYVAEVLSAASIMLSLVVYALFNITSGILTIFLPIETKDKPLHQVIEEIELNNRDIELSVMTSEKKQVIFSIEKSYPPPPPPQ